MPSQEMDERVEHLAELLVMGDLTDLRTLAEIHTLLQETGELASREGDSALAATVRSMAAFVEKMILDEAGELDVACAVFGRAFESLQRVVRDGRAIADLEWPDELSESAQPAPLAVAAGLNAIGGGLFHPGALPSHVDESIFADFLARQGGVLEEIEGLVLTIERGDGDDALAALRRVIHTVKGEAALLALADVERLCHAAEDAMTQRPASEITDGLLSLKDWLSRAFDAYAGKGISPEPADTVIAHWKPAPPGSKHKEAHAAPEAEPTHRVLEGDPSLLSEFVSEATEHLDAADLHLLTLETDPGNQDAINAVFRAFHTIKGVSGFLALNEVQSLAHEAENLLDRSRKGELELVGRAIDVTFDAVDMLKQLIGNVGTALGSGEPMELVPGMSSLILQIKSVALGLVPTQQAPEELPSTGPGKRLGEILVDSGAVTEDAIQGAMGRQRVTPSSKKLGEILVEEGKVSPAVLGEVLKIQAEDPSLGRTGEMLVEFGAVSETELSTALEQQRVPQQAPRLGQLLVESGEADAKDVAQALRAQKTQQGGVQVREAVKVDADRLDLLVDMIGELVIAESMVSQSQELQGGISTDLARHLSQLDKITRELQEMGTSLRMVPVRSTFQKMARLVRDLAKKSGKQVEFTSAGEETELDKSVVDKIGDPLVHMVRNAVDHGLESTVEDRTRVGKPVAGRVELRAFHKGGSIYIEIEDDGRGLDREAILAKGRERGLIREGDVLSDRDVYSLIFEPGFSTAKKITDVSGRGVGMDVVKRNIEALRGQVDIQSKTGQGTVFSIRLPLTLAIIDGMVVRVGQERYILPTLSIVMSIRPEDRQLSTVVQSGEMIEIQGRLLPLFRLASLFDVGESIGEATSGIVVVVEDEGKQTGLLVDEILGQQQIVIKSLGETLRGTTGLAGGAIMPDGHVGLILDVGGLVRLANEGCDS